MTWTITLLLVVNIAGIFLFSRYSFNDTYWLLQTKWRAMLHSPALDWLILGDSTCNQGVDADMFSRTFGRCYNFGTFNGALIKTESDMLRVYIQRHGPPKGVLMVNDYNIWFRKALATVLANSPVPVRQFSGYWVDGQSRARFLGRYAADLLFPLSSQTLSYRGLCTQPDALFDPRRPLSSLGTEMQVADRPDLIPKEMKEHHDYAAHNKFFATRVNAKAMHEILELADHYNFDVYFSMPPLYDSLLADSSVKVLYDQSLQYVESFEKVSPHFHFLKPFPILEPAERMIGVHHTTRAASLDFTRLLIHRIQALREAQTTSNLP
jgi:hypothetical protein